jgi:hypothetical protein
VPAAAGIAVAWDVGEKIDVMALISQSPPLAPKPNHHPHGTWWWRYLTAVMI